MEEICDESESKIEFSGDSDGLFSDENDNEIIDSVAPDERLDNSANLEPLQFCLDTGNESVTETFQKKQKKTVTSHKAYTPPVQNMLKRR